LNGLAAKWAEQHGRLFPVDARDIAPPLKKIAPAGETSPVAAASIEETVRDTSEATSPATSSSTAPAAASDAPKTVDVNPAADPEPWTERISIE
jgi:hypothetical protein